MERSPERSQVSTEMVVLMGGALAIFASFVVRAVASYLLLCCVLCCRGSSFCYYCLFMVVVLFAWSCGGKGASRLVPDVLDDRLGDCREVVP